MGPKIKPQKEPRQGMFLRVARHIHQAIAAEANREKRTIGAQAEHILEEHFTKKEADAARSA